jgi:hypothetical protein
MIMIIFEEALTIELEKALRLRGWHSEQFIRDLAESRAQTRILAERERADHEHIGSLADDALYEELGRQTAAAVEANARFDQAKQEREAQAELTRIRVEVGRTMSLVTVLREEVGRRETLARSHAVKALIADKSIQGAISRNIDALEGVLELYIKWPNANPDDGTRAYFIATIQGLRRLQPGNHADSN